MFVIVPREELPARKNTKPCENHVLWTFCLVNYEGRDQKRASRLHFRAPTLRHHRYLRGLNFEIIKNLNEISTFMLKIPKPKRNQQNHVLLSASAFTPANGAQGPPDTAPRGSKVSQTQLWSIQQRRLRGGGRRQRRSLKIYGFPAFSTSYIFRLFCLRPNVFLVRCRR